MQPLTFQKIRKARSRRGPIVIWRPNVVFLTWGRRFLLNGLTFVGVTFLIRTFMFPVTFRVIPIIILSPLPVTGLIPLTVRVFGPFLYFMFPLFLTVTRRPFVKTLMFPLLVLFVTSRLSAACRKLINRLLMSRRLPFRGCNRRRLVTFPLTFRVVPMVIPVPFLSMPKMIPSGLIFGTLMKVTFRQRKSEWPPTSDSCYYCCCLYCCCCSPWVVFLGHWVTCLCLILIS